MAVKRVAEGHIVSSFYLVEYICSYSLTIFLTKSFSSAVRGSQYRGTGNKSSGGSSPRLPVQREIDIT